LLEPVVVLLAFAPIAIFKVPDELNAKALAPKTVFVAIAPAPRPTVRP
jgi:hypothetical protein